jgi:hypothetical protein
LTIEMDGQPEGEASGAPAPLAPRRVRARRRRRRRTIGALLFVAVAVGVFAAAYLVLVADDSSDRAASTTSAPVTVTTAPKPAGPYRVTTGVNIRRGPGTTFPSVGAIETGRQVFVSCVIDGQPVDGPSGPITKWLRLTGFGPAGYLTLAYVDVGDDLNVPGKIPPCAT